MSQMQSVERCMGDVEEQLDAWEQQHQQQAAAAKLTPGRGFGSGGASASRLSTTVLYDTINLQVWGGSYHMYLCCCSASIRCNGGADVVAPPSPRSRIRSRTSWPRSAT